VPKKERRWFRAALKELTSSKLGFGTATRNPILKQPLPTCQAQNCKARGVHVPRTVKAKLLLGWMNRKDAISVLQDCYINGNPHTERKATIVWNHYRAKVQKLEPVICNPLEELPLTEAECLAAQAHLADLNTKVPFQPQVVKLNPANLLLRQFHVVTERAEEYGQQMEDEQTRINHCFGIGLSYVGQLATRLLNPTLQVIDLPHFEFKIDFDIQRQMIVPRQFSRYVSVFRADPTRTVLWAGYHRTYALLCQLGGEGCGAAIPLFTTVTGAAEVNDFMRAPSFARTSVLCDRPALLRDFLDAELFMDVNLRRKRAQGFARILRPGKVEWGLRFVDDDS
jgi:hypothetical protein